MNFDISFGSIIVNLVICAFTLYFLGICVLIKCLVSAIWLFKRNSKFFKTQEEFDFAPLVENTITKCSKTLFQTGIAVGIVLAGVLLEVFPMWLIILSFTIYTLLIVSILLTKKYLQTNIKQEAVK